MQYQRLSDADDVEATVTALPADVASPSPGSVPRRRILRALSGVAAGAVVLLGLSSCGGEEDEGDEEEDD